MRDGNNLKWVGIRNEPEEVFTEERLRSSPPPWKWNEDLSELTDANGGYILSGTDRIVHDERDARVILNTPLLYRACEGALDYLKNPSHNWAMTAHLMRTLKEALGMIQSVRSDKLVRVEPNA